MKTTSKAHASNVIKININTDKRKKKRATRKRRNKARMGDEQSVVFQSIQPSLPTGVLSHLDREKSDAKTKQTNDLLVKALTDTNSNVLKLATSIAKPTYIYGHAPPPMPETTAKPPKAPATPKKTKPPKAKDVYNFLNAMDEWELKKLYERRYDENANFGRNKKRGVIKMIMEQDPDLKDLKMTAEHIYPPSNHPNINTNRGGGGGGMGSDSEGELGLGGLGGFNFFE